MTHLRLQIANQTTGESYEIVCDESGSDARFHVALPAGDYALQRVKMNKLESPISGRFSLSNGELVYIGALRRRSAGFMADVAEIAVGAASDDALRSAGGYTPPPGTPGSHMGGPPVAVSVLADWFAEDLYENAVSDFRERYPHLQQPVRRAIVKP